MKRIGICILMGLLINMFDVGSFARDDYIYVGCMDRAKNLNPYLAQSEIELALQQIVFPPLIADSGKKGKNENSFVGVLINDLNIIYKRDTKYVDFGIGHSRICPQLKIEPGIIIENVERLRQLRARSNFSFNLIRAEQAGNNKVRIVFASKNMFSKLAAAVFPIVNFEAVRNEGGIAKWNRDDNLFIDKKDKYGLIGYSDYRYESIMERQNTITLAPLQAAHTKHSKKLSVKTFPDYKQLVDGLKANEIQVGLNISPLTNILSEGIAWADEQFGRNSILYLEITDKGRRNGLDHMNMGLINKVRDLFKEKFERDDLLRRSGWIYNYQGLLNEDIEYSGADQPVQLKSKLIKLFFIKTTVNEKVANILEEVFNDIGYDLEKRGMDRNIERKNIDDREFDLIMIPRFINTPKFLNLRFYLDWKGGRRFAGEINEILTQGGETSVLNINAERLEQRILNELPIIFLVRYNTRIAYRRDKLTRDINSPKGNPFFFFNLSQWKKKR